MRILYKNHFTAVVEEEAHSSTGKKYSYVVVTGEPVAAVLPVFEDGTMLLELQYRRAIRRHIYEIPAGHADKGEAVEMTAKRELEEETGYTASEFAFLFKAYESPAGKRQTVSVYLATGLKKGKKHLDDTESIQIKRVSLDAALNMIRKNMIIDMKTIATILFYKEFIKAKK